MSHNFAWRLKQLKCFEQYEIEDIEQDLLVEILPSLSLIVLKVNSLSTFVDKIITRRSKNLINKQMCIKRGGKTRTLSLDQEDKNGQSLIDYLTDSYCFEDSIDVNHIIQQLPENFQKLCEQLKLFTITEVSQMSGRSRAAIYRDLEVLRSLLSRFI